MISVRTDLKKLRAELRGVEREVDKASLRAINRTGAQMETQGVRLISKWMGLTQRAVRSRLKRAKAFRGRLTFILDAFGARVNIASFKGSRQTKKGVSSRAWGKRKVYPGTFLIQGDRTAMKRVGKERRPIKPVHGPGIAESFEKNRGLIQAWAEKVWPKNIAAAIQFALRKYQ